MSSMNFTSEKGFKFKEPPSDLFSTLNSFRKAEQFCDVKLKVGDKEFHVHKVVLAASSEYFKVYFSSQFPEAHQPEVELTTVDADIMEIVLDFAYSNLVEITSSNILAVMHAANFLQMESLVIACCEYLEENISADVCFGVWRLRNLCSDRFRYLAEKARKLIIANFDVASQTQDFLELESNALIDIIKNNDLNVDKEDVVFEAVVRWLSSKKERFCEFDKVLGHVRLAYVNPTVLQDYVESMDLFKSPLCMKLVEEARKYHLLHPSRRADVLSSIRIRRFSARDREALVIQDRDGTEENLLCVSRNGDIVENIKYPPGYPRIIAVSSYNNIILAGSWDAIYQYNFETDEWLRIEGNLKPRFFYGLCELDGCWYAVGGQLLCGRLSDDVEIYDPVSKIWKPVPFMRYAVSFPAVVSYKGLLYVLGGSLSKTTGCVHVQRYDPRRKKWATLTNMPVAVRFPAACVLDGMIYVFSISRESREVGRQVLVYNVSTDKWHYCTDIPRAFLGGPAIMEGRIYVLTNDEGDDSSIMCYSPLDDYWVPFGNIQGLKSKLMCGPIIL